MPISVIPVTGLVLGPIGSISQTDYPLISPRQVNDTDTNPIAFGETFVLNANNTYSSVKQFIAINRAAAFLTLMTQGIPGTGPFPQAPVTPFALGIAKDAVLTNNFYPLQGGTNMPAGAYAPGMMVNGLTRGTITVAVNNGTPPRASFPVFIRTAFNPAIPAGVIGGIEGIPDSTSAIIGTPNPGNQGSGEITGLSQLSGVRAGIYAVTFTSPTAYTVTDPIGTLRGVGAIGTPFSAGSEISLTIANIPIPFIAGDGFTVDVLTSSNLMIPNIVFKTGILSTDPNTGKSASQVTILERRVV